MTEVNPSQQKVLDFLAESEVNYIFACQASVPLVFTPDLLYQLWNNFKQYHYVFDPKTLYKIPYWAVSDLLLSPLCEEIGNRLYQLKKEIRSILLSNLVAHLGEQRKNTLALFLKDYAELEYKTSRRQDVRDVHLLTADSILNPVEMEKRIIAHINRTESDVEKMNFLLLHKQLLPIGLDSDLATITRQLGEKAGPLLRPVLIGESDPDAPGVLHVRLPRELRGRIRKVAKMTEESAVVGEEAAVAPLEDSLDPFDMANLLTKMSWLFAQIIDKKEQLKGTGFVIRGGLLNETLGNDPYLLTSRHVINQDGQEGALRPEEATISITHQITTYHFLCDEAVWSSETLDISLLRFDKESLHKMKDLIPNQFWGEPPIGEPSRAGKEAEAIYMIGYGSNKLSVASGSINSQVSAEKIFYLIGVGLGSAGSPVFNSKWQLIGVHLGVTGTSMGHFCYGAPLAAISSAVGKLYFPPRMDMPAPVKVSNQRSVLLLSDNYLPDVYALFQDQIDKLAKAKPGSDILFQDFILSEGNLKDLSVFENILDRYDSIIFLMDKFPDRLYPRIRELILVTIRKEEQPVHFFINQTRDEENRNDDDIIDWLDAMSVKKFYYVNAQTLKEGIEKWADELEAVFFAENDRQTLKVYELARELDEKVFTDNPSKSIDKRYADLHISILEQLHQLGETILPLLPQLAGSHSQGKRLAAIVGLQFRMEVGYLNWLADRFSDETELMILTETLLSMESAKLKQDPSAMFHALNRAFANCRIVHQPYWFVHERLHDLMKSVELSLPFDSPSSKLKRQYEGSWIGHFINGSVRTAFEMGIWVESEDRIAGVIKDEGVASLANVEGHVYLREGTIDFVKEYRNIASYQVYYKGRWVNSTVIKGEWRLNQNLFGTFQMNKKRGDQAKPSSYIPPGSAQTLS